MDVSSGASKKFEAARVGWEDENGRARESERAKRALPQQRISKKEKRKKEISKQREGTGACMQIQTGYYQFRKGGRGVIPSDRILTLFSKQPI